MEEIIWLCVFVIFKERLIQKHNTNSNVNRFSFLFCVKISQPVVSPSWSTHMKLCSYLQIFSKCENRAILRWSISILENFYLSLWHYQSLITNMLPLKCGALSYCCLRHRDGKIIFISVFLIASKMYFHCAWGRTRSLMCRATANLSSA